MSELSATGLYHFERRLETLFEAWFRFCAADEPGCRTDLREWWNTATEDERREWCAGMEHDLAAVGIHA